MLLEKMLQSQGFGSRKECQRLIKEGHVRINDAICDQPKQKIQTEHLAFQVFGEHYQFREKIYIALNKPQGFECSHQPQYHQSVFALFPEMLIQRNLQCVGRLDQDTTGLLLLTDDGQFLQALTHPRKHVAKVYRVTTADPITPAQLESLTSGVELRNEEGIYRATNVQQLAEYQLEMTIHQGLYHQVKRMIAAVGNKVVQLHRQQIGQLTLPSDLAESDWYYLSEQDIQLAKTQDLL
ncbi:16S rRNA pseudouridine(516) synthase [Acinetobacter sp. MD2(2019)]|uniref:pseudouridine synthase n=1 Tax=Acinetobacter sp. MD2(2019) TaxID=2605273 RepID=UPI002D1F2141|nr:16S rRNA pseudouridine(516) synthase [Acinetobacter sp. MD2(2019)]MEB3752853.1 16S rRNA pseudouridine(516) synthase [Acinetobacter sp. MD2(2019)]